MNAQTANERIHAHCPPAADPPLTGDQQALLLAYAAATDADGVVPTADGWTATYDMVGVWRAVVHGWEMKAGNASGRFNFTADGATFNRGQVLDHCEAMADRYRRRLAKAVKT